MDNSLIASCKVTINASPAQVWDVLTNPAKIKDYLFGTQVTSDWEVGSPISFVGEYNGTTYNDKGTVKEVVPNERLVYEYWTGFSGLEDVPENYATVTHTIDPINNNEVVFTWHQRGFTSPEGQQHTEQGLVSILDKIKELAVG